jgi:hypothetical protein
LDQSPGGLESKTPAAAPADDGVIVSPYGIVRTTRIIMDNMAFTPAEGEAAILGRPRAFDTILYGGLVVGILDGLFALIYYGLYLGIPMLRVFQSVASGVLGQSAFEGEVKTFLLGVGLHFVVAFCIAAVYYLASLKLPVLIRQAVICGLVYGVIAYLGMNYVIIPLSAVPPRRFNLPVFLTALIGHIFLVGLPLGLITRWSAKTNKRG